MAIESIVEQYKKEQTLRHKLIKDRNDFGFDSIYFRYSEAIQELSFFKEREAIKNNDASFHRTKWVNTKLQHFYECLEQWTQAHQEVE